MRKLKTLYNNYIARRHCEFTVGRASSYRLHISYSISPIWKRCPLYDETIIQQYLITFAKLRDCIDRAFLVYDDGVLDN